MNPLDDLDYYALLDVKPTASADAVRDAFRAFAELHHPDKHRSSHPDVRSAAQEWFRRGTEAYRVLQRPDTRRLYDLGLTKGRKRFDATAPIEPDETEVDAGAPLTTTSGKAAPFLKKALEALEAGNVSAARMNLQFVVQFDPGNRAVKARLDALG